MNSETVSSFGEMLRAFRKRSRLTQRQLAISLGLHFNTVGNWERGERLPEQRGIVLQIARRLHLNEQESRQFLEASLTALAPYWSVPFSRNPFFTGREQFLEEVHMHLKADQVAALSHLYAIHGLGGIGKTQLAVEYAYRYALEYAAVFWISAESGEQILTSLQAIAERLGLPERHEADQHPMVTAVQNWLSAHSRWLLIWDNLEEEALLRRYLPPVRQGAVLITTRRQALGVVAQDMELPTMTHSEGMLLFLRRAKLLPAEASQEQVACLAARHANEYKLVQEVVKTLGELPLALDQAGAYIEATKCSVRDYFTLLQSAQFRLLNEYDGSSNYSFSVARTFTLVFEQLKRSNLAAVEVITLCAFLAPEAIPEAFFLEGATLLGAPFESLAADLFAFQAVLKALLKYSLIQRDASTHTLSLHRLVQVVLKGQLSSTEWSTWIGRITRTLIHLFSFNENTRTDYWQTCEQLLPHALQCLSLNEAGSEEEALAFPLLNHVAAYLFKRARYAKAEPLFVRAIQVGERVFGLLHPLTAEALNGLGVLYREQGKYEQAEPLLQRALQIWEQTWSPDYPQMASALKSLGRLYALQGKYERAETLFQQALQIWEQTWSPDYPQVASALKSLGRLYADQGKYEQAETLFQQALQIWEQTLGSDHPQIAAPLNSLGNLYFAQDKYEQAETSFQRALQIWEQALGSDHPQVALPLTNLGKLYVAQSKYEWAEALFQRALQTWEQAWGSNHPVVAAPLGDLGRLYAAQCRYEQAEALFQRALRIREQALGSDHPQVALPLTNLGRLYAAQSKYERAEALFQRALQIWEQALGPGHPRVAYLLSGLADLYREQGKYEQAEAFYHRTLKLRLQLLGPQHPDVAETLYDLARLQQGQHRVAEALSQYQRALAIREQSFGPYHPRTLETKKVLLELEMQLERVPDIAASDDQEAAQSLVCACGCGRQLDISKSRGEPRRFFSNACKQRFYRNTLRRKRNMIGK